LDLTLGKRSTKLNTITHGEIAFGFSIDTNSRKALWVVSDRSTIIERYRNRVLFVIVRNHSSIIARLNVVDLASRVVANDVLAGRISQRKCALCSSHVLSINEDSHSVVVSTYESTFLKLLMNDRVDCDSFAVCRRYD